MLKVVLMLFLFFKSGALYAASAEVCGSKTFFDENLSHCECKKFPPYREDVNVFGLKPYAVCGYLKDEHRVIGRFYYQGASKVSGVLRVYYSEYRSGKMVAFYANHPKKSKVNEHFYFSESDFDVNRKLFSMGVLTKKMSRTKCWEAPVSINVIQIVDNFVELDDSGFYITKYDLLTAGKVRDCSGYYEE